MPADPAGGLAPLLEAIAERHPGFLRAEPHDDGAEYSVPHPSTPVATTARAVVWQTLRSIGGVNEDRLLGAALRYADALGRPLSLVPYEGEWFASPAEVLMVHNAPPGDVLYISLAGPHGATSPCPSRLEAVLHALLALDPTT